MDHRSNQLRLIGYWIRSLDDTEYPPPQELVAGYSPGILDQVVKYLDCGQVFAVYRGISWCRFYCKHAMGNREMTDGKWVWPEDLSHYVGQHNVMLPEEFVSDACEGSSSIPPVRNEMWEGLSANAQYWIEWCSAHRSNSLQQKLAAARLAADEESERIRIERSAEIENAEGVSETMCQHAGCNNHALKNRVICASCLVQYNDEFTMRSPYNKVRAVLVGNDNDSEG